MSKGFDVREWRWGTQSVPFDLRSMSRFELRLRGLAGSGWNGEHPTGYRWAQRLCDVLERFVWT